MQTREIGNDKVGRVRVGAIGLGLMTFDQTGAQPRQQLLDTVRAAIDAGVSLFDTADAYGPGDELGGDAQGANERLIAGLLDELGVRDRVLLATKGGHVRGDGGGVGAPTAATATCTRRSTRACSASASSRSRCGSTTARTRRSPTRTWSARSPRSTRPARSGWSGCPTRTRPRSGWPHDVLGDALVSVQNQFSPAFRSSRPEIDVCEELGLAFLPWSPLGGLSDAKALAEKHPAFAEIATERGVSAQQVALAWELAQSPVVIPIPGAKRPQSIADSAAAADLELSAEEVARLDAS